MDPHQKGKTDQRRWSPRWLGVVTCGLLWTTSATAQGFTEVGAAAGFTLPQRVNVSPRICNSIPYACLVDYTGGVAVGDLDGDGDSDVVLSRPDASMLVYLNESDGTFTDSSATLGLGAIPGASGVTLADVDGDGRLDLLVSVIAVGAGRLFLNRWPDPFEERAATNQLWDFDTPHASSGFGVAVGDYDRDGVVDVFTSHWGGRDKACGEPRSRLYRGDRSVAALMSDVTEAVAPQVLDLRRVTWVSYGSAFSDIDGDGWPDLLVTGDFSQTQFFWNDAGTFTRAEPGIGRRRFGMGSTIADFDGDGHLDIFMTGISPEILSGLGHGLFLYRGARTFVDATVDAGVVTGGWGWGTAAIDYDHDGDMDIIAATGDDFDGNEDDPIIFYRNDGDGTFTEVAQSLGLLDLEPGRGLAVFDYDADGDQDVLIVRNGLTPLLYRNDAGVSQGDYLRVRAVGTRGNGEGLGARVEVTVGERTWVSEINSITHFIGQSERVAHVGLGTGASPRTATVRVRFLGGHEVVLEDQALNREIVVTEPDAPFPEAPAPPPPPAPDCDMNGTPDYCSPDCDASGSPDTCDVTEGRAPDCNANGVIDSCEIATGFETDCDASGVPDACEVRDGVLADCDGSGAPDVCEAEAEPARDCDGNELLDVCEIAAQPWLDCNDDGVLDVCRGTTCGGDAGVRDMGTGSPDGGGVGDAGMADDAAVLDGGSEADAARADAGTGTLRGQGCAVGLATGHGGVGFAVLLVLVAVLGRGASGRSRS
jgi:hypothetical protein